MTRPKFTHIKNPFHSHKFMEKSGINAIFVCCKWHSVHRLRIYVYIRLCARPSAYKYRTMQYMQVWAISHNMVVWVMLFMALNPPFNFLIEIITIAGKVQFIQMALIHIAWYRMRPMLKQVRRERMAAAAAAVTFVVVLNVVANENYYILHNPIFGITVVVAVAATTYETMEIKHWSKSACVWLCVSDMEGGNSNSSS